MRLVLVLAVALSAAPAVGQQPALHVNEREVYEIAAQLRCVVCQNLSVADSPSEMASQMRGIVRERLAAGDSPAQVIEYFVGKYGDWILLSPRRRGFTMLVWIAPFAAVAVGLAVVAVVVRRWTRRARARVGAAPDSVSAAMRERIRREMEAEP
jgi:cytochrome c-type biogenesis protein CcmH